MHTERWTEAKILKLVTPFTLLQKNKFYALHKYDIQLSQ